MKEIISYNHHYDIFNDFFVKEIGTSSSIIPDKADSGGCLVLLVQKPTVMITTFKTKIFQRNNICNNSFVMDCTSWVKVCLRRLTCIKTFVYLGWLTYIQFSSNHKAGIIRWSVNWSRRVFVEFESEEATMGGFHFKVLFGLWLVFCFLHGTWATLSEPSFSYLGLGLRTIVIFLTTNFLDISDSHH